MQRLWLVLIFLVITLSPQLAAWGESASPYPIVDSGVWATNSFPGDVYWLDNERVLFLGSKADKPVPKEHMSLLVWDTVQQSVTTQKQNIASLCYRNGIVLLGQKIDNPAGGPWKYRFFRGPLGNEQPQKKEDKDLLDHLNCRIVEHKTGHDKRPPGRYLLEGHGYLGHGGKQPPNQLANLPAVYFKGEGSEGVLLPFGVRQVESIEYYDFKRAYFLYGSFLDAARGVVTSPWPRDRPHPMWWLTPEGSVTRIEIPPGEWNAGGSVRFNPTQKGVVVTYHGGFKSYTNPGTQGLYLIREDGGAIKLISGFAIRVGVSPNGCRIAFSHAPNLEADRHPDDKNRRTLKMIDLCSKGS